MKARIQAVFIVIALLCFGVTIAGAQVVSNGTGGGDWNTTTTWIGGNVPIVSDNVVIQGSDVVTLAAAGTCANLTMAAGTKITLTAMTFPGTSWTLDPASTVEYVGANPPTFVYANYGNLIWSAGAQSLSSNLTVNGNLSVTGTTAKLKGAGSALTLVHTVAGNVTVSSTVSPAFDCVDNANGSATWNIGGNLIVNGIVSGLASASATTGATAIINVAGDLTIGASGTLQYGSNAANASPFTLSVKGNFTSVGTIIKKAGVAPGTWTISMDGTSTPQNLSFVTGTSAKSTGVVCTLRVNNPNGVILTAPFLVDQNWTVLLANGLLTTTSTNIPTISSLGAVSAGSASSFVNGPIAFTCTTAVTRTYTYPIGKGSVYRPITLSLTQTAVTLSTYTAEMFNAAPATNALPGDASLDKVSLVRYYNIAEGGGGSAFTAGTVTLSYDADDGVTDGASLRIAQNDGAGNWVNLGGSGASPITSVTAFTSLTGTVFTLANATGGSNPLPVEMTSFTASMQSANCAMLKWSTATEVNNSGFEIERRSANGEQSTVNSWQKVGFVSGAGTSNAPKTYSYEDKNLAPGVYVYRMKQIDNDGTTTIYNPNELPKVDAGVSNTFQLCGNYPNPFNPTTNMQFSVPQDGYASLKVYNMVGQEVATLFSGIAKAGHYIPATFNASRLASGIYFARLQYNGKSLVQRMLMIK